MNRTINKPIVKRSNYDSHDQLPTHLAHIMAAYNVGRKLKSLSGIAPYEYIAKIWTSEAGRLIVDPSHQMPGLNTWAGPDVVNAPIGRSSCPFGGVLEEASRKQVHHSRLLEVRRTLKIANLDDVDR